MLASFSLRWEWFVLLYPIQSAANGTHPAYIIYRVYLFLLDSFPFKYSFHPSTQPCAKPASFKMAIKPQFKWFGEDCVALYEKMSLRYYELTHYFEVILTAKLC